MFTFKLQHSTQVDFTWKLIIPDMTGKIKANYSRYGGKMKVDYSRYGGKNKSWGRMPLWIDGDVYLAIKRGGC